MSKPVFKIEDFYLSENQTIPAYMYMLVFQNGILM